MRGKTRPPDFGSRARKRIRPCNATEIPRSRNRRLPDVAQKPRAAARPQSTVCRIRPRGAGREGRQSAGFGGRPAPFHRPPSARHKSGRRHGTGSGPSASSAGQTAHPRSGTGGQDPAASVPRRWACGRNARLGWPERHRLTPIKTAGSRPEGAGSKNLRHSGQPGIEPL